MQIVTVEFTYSVVVEVPDDATTEQIKDIAQQWHEKALDEGIDPPINREVRYMDADEAKDYEPVNREVDEE